VKVSESSGNELVIGGSALRNLKLNGSDNMSLTAPSVAGKNYDGQVDTIRISHLLPKHDEISLLSRSFYLVCIVTATVLLIWNTARLSMALNAFPWWLPFVTFAGMVAADFGSGMIHWTADTWGSISMPIFGRRFLHPFRVHHVNPHDFLCRSFLATNGDVAMVLIPFLSAALVMPTGSPWQLLFGVFLTALCAAGLPTNQVHQWAHMPKPPVIVRMLQNQAIILSHQAHAQHHTPPHIDNYCIALGWCNPLLLKLDFWRRMELLVTWATGVRPRTDEDNFKAEAGRILLERPPRGEFDDR
jgi:plasmanylethanolamine desaturase